VDRARKLELVATYRQTVLTAYQDVEDMLSALTQLRDQEALQAAAVTAARQAAALAERQYRLGGADELTVLTTQQSLYQAQDSLAQIHLQQLEASVGLCRALGGGFGLADGTPPHTPPLSDGTRP
jgi:outer membrane protein TolC